MHAPFTGQVLTTNGNWSVRDFTITDSSGGLVAKLVTTSSPWSMRSADLTLEIGAPVMTLLQAIGMAQCPLTVVGSPRGDAT